MSFIGLHPSRRELLLGGAAALAAASLPGIAWAAYPEKQIRMIVSFPPGGTGDSVGRIWANAIAPKLGQTIIVENQGGAAGAIGSGQVARATPDGYTLLFSAAAVFAVLPHMAKPTYDALNDLIPIAKIGDSLRALAVNPKVPAKDLKEFIAYAKANPGKLTYGSPGIGSTPHIITESFSRAVGIRMTHVPYRGANPALQGLLAGDIDVMIETVVQPHILSGALRGLVAVGERRLRNVPDMPTLAEAGVTGLRTSGWTAVFAPAKTPQEVIDTLARHTEALYKDQPFLDSLIKIGVEPDYRGPKEFAQDVRSDHDYFGKVIREAGIKKD